MESVKDISMYKYWVMKYKNDEKKDHIDVLHSGDYPSNCFSKLVREFVRKCEFGDVHKYSRHHPVILALPKVISANQIFSYTRSIGTITKVYSDRYLIFEDDGLEEIIYPNDGDKRWININSDRHDKINVPSFNYINNILKSKYNYNLDENKWKIYVDYITNGECPARNENGDLKVLIYNKYGSFKLSDIAMTIINELQISYNRHDKVLIGLYEILLPRDKTKGLVIGTVPKYINEYLLLDYDGYEFITWPGDNKMSWCYMDDVYLKCPVVTSDLLVEL